MGKTVPSKAQGVGWWGWPNLQRSEILRTTEKIGQYLA